MNPAATTMVGHTRPCLDRLITSPLLGRLGGREIVMEKKKKERRSCENIARSLFSFLASFFLRSQVIKFPLSPNRYPFACFREPKIAIRKWKILPMEELMGTCSIKVSSISSPIVSMRVIRSKKKMKERDSMPDLDEREERGRTKNLESNFHVC